MSLLNADTDSFIQNWPLPARADFANSLKYSYCNYSSCLNLSKVVNHHHLAPRSAAKNEPKMPVVFKPQKSQTECERDSRMSSFGFMSFVLSVVNGVINISNNINNNNNNRNNNNNDDNKKKKDICRRIVKKKTDGRGVGIEFF